MNKHPETEEESLTTYATNADYPAIEAEFIRVYGGGEPESVIDQLAARIEVLEQDMRTLMRQIALSKGMPVSGRFA